MDLSRASPWARNRLPWVLEQAAIVLLGAFVYFRVRGLTDSSTRLALEHARDLFHVERLLGIDVEASLQAPLDGSALLETLSNWVYIWGHWPVIILTMTWLALRHGEVFLRLRDAMLVSGALGMLVFVSYPVAPPRLAHLGLVDTITQSSDSYRYLQPPAFVNQYAALPSLHVGWDLLVGMAIFSATTNLALRVIGCLMPLAMAYAVIATANHFVLDVLAGIVLVLIGHATALWLQRRRARRREQEAA
ncbi:phosphatase PAP2 family protein [Nocardioides panaciterrulae]|uniref:Membrane-associated phospholipid phosphatase n=1 Tax=Nocardioides panaciterrulae TaxID=661492 RepID=A0A7Y9E6C5_9ACTN|nr:phosphatase PAP2 family protein [Nocardioides panaciterrulae]NYD41735.1 membrane-associated phospholipid phosphatase [Nocardioides panaciterrulae]